MNKSIEETQQVIGQRSSSHQNQHQRSHFAHAPPAKEQHDFLRHMIKTGQKGANASIKVDKGLLHPADQKKARANYDELRKVLQNSAKGQQHSFDEQKVFQRKTPGQDPRKKRTQVG